MTGSLFRQCGYIVVVLHAHAYGILDPPLAIHASVVLALERRSTNVNEAFCYVDAASS